MLDENAMSFAEKVYGLIKKVPPGRVTTYKEIAKALNIKSYRAVGQALKKNPYSPLVPCHRCVSSSGKVWGFKGSMNEKQVNEKIMLLKKEGIEFNKNNIKNFEKVLYKFTS